VKSSAQVYEPVVRRGEIYWANLGERRGSELEGTHPVLIIQNDLGNKHSPTTIVATLTTKLKKKTAKLHVRISPATSGLPKEGMVLTEQLVTLDKKIRLGKRIGELTDDKMREVDLALHRSLGLQ
jgi:mRNA interferase MazF